MAATAAQIKELAQAIANQAQAIADGKFPGQNEMHSQAALLASNARMLEAWAPLADPGYCEGCGQTFSGARGLRAHQGTRYITNACKGNK